MLTQVEEIRTLIELIIQNISIVKDLQNNVLSHTNKDIQKELESRTNAISQTAFRVQQKLRDMGKDITSIEDLTVASAREGPAYMRIKVLQYTTMLKMFSDIMQEYNSSMLRYHEKCLLLLQQQKALTRKHITSEELDELLNSQETNLFIDNFLQDSESAKQQLSEIQDRHKEIIKVEKSIAEIRDMFMEMAFLIEKQGEQLNSVEYFAGTTVDNVDSGRIDLKKANQRSHRYRKKKIKIAIILSVIIILFLLILIFM